MANNHALLDRTFAALSDPTRRAIIARLCQGEARVGELAEPFTIGLPTLLKHIRVLEAGGLVTSRKAGRVRTCSLAPEALRGADSWLRAHIMAWENRLDRLEAHLGRMTKEKSNHD